MAERSRSFALRGSPFIPFAAKRVHANLEIDAAPEACPWSAMEGWACLTGHKVHPKPTPLFQKIADQQGAELHARFAGKASDPAR